MMYDNKPINDQLYEFQDFIRYFQSHDYKVFCLIDKLSPSWSVFAGDLHFTLVQTLKAIRIEDQYMKNSELKSDLKSKSTWWKISLKRKFMNLKGKKFKKSNHFHSSPHANSSSFKLSHSSFFKPKISGQKTDERFFYVCRRTNHLAPQCFNRKTEPVKA